jgi:hypothetical protein
VHRVSDVERTGIHAPEPVAPGLSLRHVQFAIAKFATWFCMDVKFVSDIKGGTSTEGEEWRLPGCYAVWFL